MNMMNKITVLIFTAMVAVNVMAERPIKGWVINQNAGDLPRNLILNMGEDFWVAYSKELCGVYLVWKGKFRNEGTTKGLGTDIHANPWYYIPFKNSGDLEGVNTFWKAEKNGTSVLEKVRFLGYERPDPESIVLLYRLYLNDGIKLDIRETPEYITKNGKPALERKIEISELPQGVSISYVLPPTRRDNNPVWESDGVISLSNEQATMSSSGTGTLTGVFQ